MPAPIPLDRRQAILRAAVIDLAQGIPTDIIGAKHGVSGQAIRKWLIADKAPEAEEARADYVSGQIVQSVEAMESCGNDPVALARARELFKSWAWIAERRLPDMFGQKREVKHTHSLDVTQALESARAMLQTRNAPITGKLLNADVIDSTVHIPSVTASQQTENVQDQGGDGQSQAEGMGGSSPERPSDAGV